jgi:hypothetical protein
MLRMTLFDIFANQFNDWLIQGSRASVLFSESLRHPDKTPLHHEGPWVYSTGHTEAQ